MTTVLRCFILSALLATAGCAVNPRAASGVTASFDAAPQAVAVPVLNDLADAARSSIGFGEITTTGTPSPAIAEGPVAMRIALSRKAQDAAAAPRSLLRVDYAATSKAPADRPRLSVALVIDRSGSMAEDRKLQYALAAARWVVDNMADGDTLAVVAFADQATVLSASGRVVNKPFLFHRLDEVAPFGSTNLSAGLLEGIAQVTNASATGQVKQVLLLTDGLANRGETAPAALRRIAELARAQDIGISTMGVGTQFNESLLADIAAAGGGRYTYVKTAEQIPSAFKDELRGLLQVVAQNMTVEIALTGGLIDKIYGQPLERPTRVYKLAVGDLRATESGFLLAELEPLGVGGMDIDLRVTFDALDAGRRVERSLRLQAPHDAAATEDQSVTLVAAMLDAVERADAALRGLDVERFGQAKALFEGLHERAREHALRTRDQQLLNQAFVLKHLMAELATVDREGLLHGHQTTRDRLAKESHYLRYLLTHHRAPP